MAWIYTTWIYEHPTFSAIKEPHHLAWEYNILGMHHHSSLPRSRVIPSATAQVGKHRGWTWRVIYHSLEWVAPAPNNDNIGWRSTTTTVGITLDILIWATVDPPKDDCIYLCRDKGYHTAAASTQMNHHSPHPILYPAEQWRHHQDHAHNVAAIQSMDLLSDTTSLIWNCLLDDIRVGLCVFKTVASHPRPGWCLKSFGDTSRLPGDEGCEDFYMEWSASEMTVHGPKHYYHRFFSSASREIPLQLLVDHK